MRGLIVLGFIMIGALQRIRGLAGDLLQRPQRIIKHLGNICTSRGSDYRLLFCSNLQIALRHFAKLCSQVYYFLFGP